MNKIFYGDTQPNPKESKIWLHPHKGLSTYDRHTKQWGNPTSSPVPEEPEKPTSLYEFVDLGLPSGTLWATTNVGAEKPEDFGLLFAWGETKTDGKKFNWSDYKLCGGLSSTLTKYNNNSSYGTVDNLTTLEQVDDAAYTSDNICRMPTKAELKELTANTTSTWETLNGVNGMRFTSKINGNSIFVPAAGYCAYGVIHRRSSQGYLWSSSLYESNSKKAWYLGFGSDSMGVVSNDRCEGFSVRAVKSIN